MDLALNNLQRLVCHKPKQPTKQPFKHCMSAHLGEFKL